MLIPLTVQKDDLDDKNDIGSYVISIIYSTTEYQEIVNLQDFDFNSAFSGIGGFIGILLFHRNNQYFRRNLRLMF